MFSKTAGFRHDAMPAGIDAIRQLGRTGLGHTRESYSEPNFIRMLLGRQFRAMAWFLVRQFSDYSLRLDWMMPGDDNGGVFIGFPDPQGDP